MTLSNSSTPKALSVSITEYIPIVDSQGGVGEAAPIRPDTSPLCGSDVGIGSRLLAGCTTGAMAVAFAQPTDVVKVRLQAQARCAGRAGRYCGTIDAYKTIAKEEGMRGLWKGTVALA